eukprot:TRINITY_DN34878_c0_g1_i1.p1 TRINITY_DN34878_c0_g1~~TRINITY_DN34878_c0_g1_i1.p1  ORF type:complete len:198 (+),score=3.75 TRINITY_DN34878_c0_g1_i1:260-853(+)
MIFFIHFFALFAFATASLPFQATKATALPHSVRSSPYTPCPSRCLPAWIAFHECLPRLNQCILKGCHSPQSYGEGPFATCTDYQPIPPPSPSPAPTGCTTGTTDHAPGEFGVQCTCPNLGVTFISIANPSDVLSCMRSCYENSPDFLEACHEYKRRNINGDLTEIRPVFLDVGRVCCENYCGGSYTSSIGKPTCSRS